MAKYDPAVLQEYADSLYDSSRWIMARWAFGLAIVGAIVAVVISEIGSRQSQNSTTGFVTFAVLGAVIGLVIGQRKSFAYRLEAQTVLCQIQIELNTRKQP